MGNYSLNINGENKKVEGVPEDMPLLWVLRDIVGLRGTSLVVERVCVEPAQFTWRVKLSDHVVLQSH